MPSRCCVGGCNSNFDSEIERTKETVTVFCFPSLKDPTRSRKSWFDSLPNIVEDTPSRRICEKHWPENYEKVNRTGHMVPRNPPSVFSVPASFCRQTAAQSRNVEHRSVDSESRHRQEEQ